MKIEKLYSRYKTIIPDFRDFMEFIKRPLLQSFRVNTLKAKRDEILLLLKDLKIKSLPFYNNGFLLQEKTRFGNHITHNLGMIYIQEIASMIPVVVLDPKPDEVVLDLCAAPGSKTTQIAQSMENSGLLVANEINRKRAQGLIHNIKRCGLLNEAVIILRGQRIDKILPDYFDRILIDAPCSAEGTIRKSKAVLYHWGLKNIQRMAKIQKGLIVSGFRALQPGGTMVYSTCTLAPEENEGVVAYLLDRFPEAEIMPITIPNFKIRPGITKWQGETFDKRLKSCARILPQDNDTAPFFIARIIKRGVFKRRIDYMGKIEFEGSAVEHFYRRFGVDPKRFKGYSIFQNKGMSFISTPQVYSFWEVKTIRKGLEFGKIYGQEIKPDNDLIQVFGKKANRNYYEIKEHQLNKFLKGETIMIDSRSGISNGFVIVTYKKMPIAIGKYNGKEIKSEVKRERRIPL
ncbi:NOL1/NOP2/sun family putative RNA methylase [candidate division WOR-3 bacterium]|nr:NOL1/NOP2/sun family putative RNA methylase [candidate division WOR-3 bacterium]